MRSMTFKDDEVSKRRFRVLVQAYAENERNVKGLEQIRKASAIVEQLEKVMETPFHAMTNGRVPEMVPGDLHLEEAPFEQLKEWVANTPPFFTGSSSWILETHNWLESLQRDEEAKEA